VFSQATTNLGKTQKQQAGRARVAANEQAKRNAIAKQDAQAIKKAEANRTSILLANARIRAKTANKTRMLLPPLRRGQGMLFFTIIAGIIFLVFFTMMTPSLQNFADSFATANPTAPTEVLALVKIAPFALMAMVFVAVAAAVGLRPSVGGF